MSALFSPAVRWEFCRRNPISSGVSAKPLPMHPALKNALLEWMAGSLYAGETDFVFPSLHRNGLKPLDLAAVLNRKIKPAFVKVGISGVGWHTFRHSVGSILASMGEHQLTIRDYLRHSNLNVTNQYLQATSKTRLLAQGRLVDAILRYPAPLHRGVRSSNHDRGCDRRDGWVGLSS